MKTIKINKLSKEKLIELLTEEVDIRIVTADGYITLTGGLKHGILSKLEKGKHYVFVKEQWVQVN